MYFREDEHINTSAGAADAGKPIVLDAAGQIDGSMIDASDVAHDSTSGAAASTIHTAFPLLAGGRNFTGIQQYDSHPTFTADEQIVDKKYVDDELTAGLAPKANIVDVMLLDGSQAMSGNMDLGGNIITNIGDGIAANDAATVGQVQAAAAGIGLKDAVRAASTANLAGFASDEITGLGASLSIDGVALAANDRVLLKDQTVATENGIFVYDGIDKLSRSADFDGDPLTCLAA